MSFIQFVNTRVIGPAIPSRQKRLEREMLDELDDWDKDQEDNVDKGKKEGGSKGKKAKLLKFSV